MSLSRVWLSGCQPLARACASRPNTHTPKIHFLGRQVRLRQECVTRPFLSDQRPSGRSLHCTTRVSASASGLEEQVKEKNHKHPVIVYSKTWCPYCAQVKGLFRDLKVDFTAVELDEVVEGEDVMDALLSITHRRTVPQVFIQGEFIGGCDDTMGAYSSGELAEKFSAAGIDANF